MRDLCGLEKQCLMTLRSSRYRCIQRCRTGLLEPYFLKRSNGWIWWIYTIFRSSTQFFQKLLSINTYFNLIICLPQADYQVKIILTERSDALDEYRSQVSRVRRRQLLILIETKARQSCVGTLLEQSSHENKGRNVYNWVRNIQKNMWVVRYTRN